MVGLRLRVWVGFIVMGFVPALTLEAGSFPLLMPGVQPKKPETYLCTPVKVNATAKHYITGFSPIASMNVAHHMLLYGCLLPGRTEEVWNCGEMVASRSPGLKSAGVCAKGSQILYAWGRNAPSLDLPEGVAFEVGGDTGIQYLVLQVHYADVSSFEDGGKDNSGVSIRYTETPQPKSAGVFVLDTQGYIAPNSTEHMESACRIHEDRVIHPFAFRTHTHTLGRVVSGYRVRRDNEGQDEWTLIGKANPMKPQMFYPVANEMAVTKGDVLAARCTMVSERLQVTRIGSTNEDEMCNFYIMYWTEGSTPLQQQSCSRVGPPYYYWNRGIPYLNNIPDAEASEI